MLDVLRHGFLPPTAAQKAADVATVTNGGELIVSCWLIPVPGSEPVRFYPHGHLHVFGDRVVLRGIRGRPDETFLGAEWLTDRSDQVPRGKYALISVVNRQDSRRYQELRVPVPDVGLIRAVMSGI